MSHHDLFNVATATSVPENHYASPDDLAADLRLTRGQRIATLKRWAFFVRARLDAAAEGMAPASSAVHADEVELFRLIEIAADQQRDTADRVIA